MNKQFLDKCEYFKKEAENGNYHNPYDVEAELICLIPEDVAEFEIIEYEDLSHDIGLLFWSM